jgi:hypothetical protein
MVLTSAKESPIKPTTPRRKVRPHRRSTSPLRHLSGQQEDAPANNAVDPDKQHLRRVQHPLQLLSHIRSSEQLASTCLGKPLRERLYRTTAFICPTSR